MNALVLHLNHFAARWASVLWQVTWQSALLALIIFLIARGARRASAHFRYWLWLLVLVKLFLPPSLSSPVSLGRLLPRREAVPAQVIPAQDEPIASPAFETIVPESASAIALPEYSPPPAPMRVAPTPLAYALAGWLLGAFLLAGLTIEKYAALRRRLASAQRNYGSVHDLATSLAKRIGIGKQVQVVVSDAVSTPLVLGLFRPLIVLPERMFAELARDELEAILLHELVHVKRRDILVNWVAALAQVLYFFNPIVWLVNRHIRDEREQVCDDRVLTILKGAPENYAHSLLQALKFRAKKALIPLGLLGLAEPSSAAERRIQRILDDRRKVMSRLSVRSVCFLVLIAAVALPLTAAPPPRKVSEQAAATPSTTEKPDSTRDLEEVAQGLAIYLLDDDTISVADAIEMGPGQLKFARKPVVAPAEIIAYDLESCDLYLSDETRKRLFARVNPTAKAFRGEFTEKELQERAAIGRHSVRPPGLGEPFVLAVDGKQLYVGGIYGGLTSHIPAGVLSLYIGRGKGPIQFSLPTGAKDPGNNRTRVFRALDRAGKLIRWGEAAQGLQCGIVTPRLVEGSASISAFLKNVGNTARFVVPRSNYFELKMDGKGYVHYKWNVLYSARMTRMEPGSVVGPILLELSEYVSEGDRRNAKNASHPLAKLSPGEHRVQLGFVGEGGEMSVPSPRTTFHIVEQEGRREIRPMKEKVLAPSVAPSPDDRAVYDKLKKKVTFDFVDLPLEDAVEFLGLYGDFNVVIDPYGVQRVFAGRVPVITLKLVDVPIETALKFITEQLGLSYAVNNGVLVISDMQGLQALTHVVEIYDISDLIGSDFKVLNVWREAYPDIVGKKDAVTGGDVVKVIQKAVAPESWTYSGVSMRFRTPGTLLVTQAPEVHEEIRELLGGIRRKLALHVSVDWWGVSLTREAYKRVKRELLDKLEDAVPPEGGTGHYLRSGREGDMELRGAFRREGQTGSGFSGRLVPQKGIRFYLATPEVLPWLRNAGKKEGIHVVEAPRITCRNGERGSVAMTTKVAYISHFKEQTEIGEDGEQTKVIVPVTKFADEGMKFSVRPLVSQDRKSVMLEFDLDMTSLAGWETRRTPLGVTSQPILVLEGFKVVTKAMLDDKQTLLVSGLQAKTEEEDQILMLLIQPEIIVIKEQEVEVK